MGGHRNVKILTKKLHDHTQRNLFRNLFLMVSFNPLFSMPQCVLFLIANPHTWNYEQPFRVPENSLQQCTNRSL